MFDPASAQAGAISALFLTVLTICAVIFVVVVSIIGYAIVRELRARANAGERLDPAEYNNRWLEIAWTATPLMLVIGIFVLSVKAADTADPASDGRGPVNEPPTAIVRAHQWWWEIEYPKQGVVTANELHLPVGTKIQLQLESADVIHDFWVPALARKIDIIPGRSSHLVFEATRTGRFQGACAEFCGTQHAWMRLDVVVQSSAEYRTWLAAQAKPALAPTERLAKDGLAIYAHQTCSQCHTLSSNEPRVPASTKTIGPDLTHFASRATLGAGVLDNDHAHLVAWLKNPQAIKRGCRMPSFRFSDSEAESLSAYLAGLR